MVSSDASQPTGIFGEVPAEPIIQRATIFRQDGLTLFGEKIQTSRSPYLQESGFNYGPRDHSFNGFNYGAQKEYFRVKKSDGYDGVVGKTKPTRRYLSLGLTIRVLKQFNYPTMVWIEWLLQQEMMTETSYML